jgi:hypothetical protein
MGPGGFALPSKRRSGAPLLRARTLRQLRFGLFSSVYSFEAPLVLQREHDELSATDAWTEIAVGNVVNYALFPCGTVQNSPLSRTVGNQIVVIYLIPQRASRP